MLADSVRTCCGRLSRKTSLQDGNALQAHLLATSLLTPAACLLPAQAHKALSAHPWLSKAEFDSIKAALGEGSRGRGLVRTAKAPRTQAVVAVLSQTLVAQERRPSAKQVEKQASAVFFSL